MCSLCGSADSLPGNLIVFCDGVSCGRCFHQMCLTPALVDVPEGSWLCRACARSGNRVNPDAQLNSPKATLPAADAPELPAPTAAAGSPSQRSDGARKRPRDEAQHGWIADAVEIVREAVRQPNAVEAVYLVRDASGTAREAFRSTLMQTHAGALLLIRHLERRLEDYVGHDEHRAISG